MKKMFVAEVVIFLMATATALMATPPTMPKRNIDIKAELVSVPHEIGDLFQVNWSFTFHRDTINWPARVREDWDSAAAKAYLYFTVKQQFVSGDSVWWGRPQYDMTYQLTATYRLIEARSLNIFPRVEFHSSILQEGGFMSRNLGRGIEIPFPVIKTESDTLIEVVGNDTITTIRNFQLPREYLEISRVQRILDEYYNVDSNTRNFNISNYFEIEIGSKRNGDTIAIAVPRDSTARIHFLDSTPWSFRIVDSGDIHIKKILPRSIKISVNHSMKKKIIELEFGGTKRIFFKIEPSWQLDGTFRFKTPFGQTALAMIRMHCFFYEWQGDHFEQALVSATDSYGHFSFTTTKDTVAVMVFSSNNYSNVFYADDSCFNGSLGEKYYNHGYGIITINLEGTNHTIPDVYTTITDMALAAPFHLANIMSYSNDCIGFPSIYPRVPIYFLNSDACVTGSSFGSFAIADVKGICILGDNGLSDNCDQWDTCVVLHELGHFYEYSMAEMPPNSGGQHTFYDPPYAPDKSKLGTAFAEGWATFFSNMIIGRSSFVDYTKIIPDTNLWIELELPNPDVPYYLGYNQPVPSSTTPYYEGAMVEGSIALSLWDLYDDNNDDNYFIGSQLRGHNNDHNSGLSWQDIDPIWDVLTNYDPQPDNTDHDHCWNIYEFIDGWRKEGYPFNSTFKNIFGAHNIMAFIPGDFDGNDIVNLLDILAYVEYKMKGGAKPYPMSRMDVNADCTLDLLDALYLISYKFKEGPEPLVGCVEE
jgi:hypothetical protein